MKMYISFVVLLTENSYLFPPEPSDKELLIKNFLSEFCHLTSKSLQQ